MNNEAIMMKMISINFSNYETFSIDLYTPDFSKDIYRSFKIELSSTSDFRKYFSANIFAGRRLYIGWNRLVFSKSDFTIIIILKAGQIQ